MHQASIKGKASEEDLEDLRKKVHLLEADRKAFYHTSVVTKQRNKEQIKQLQQEIKELRKQVKNQAITTGAAKDDPKAAENMIAKTEKELALWRRKWDESVAKSK